jgi:CDP-glycerol glycerophosphotransferase
VRVVYNTFEGRYGDSPRVVHDALAARGIGDDHVWILDPVNAATFPPGVETVEYRTPECRATLEAADLVVANTHVDMEWSKPPACLFMQLWHGTPLKRIHWDVLWAPPGRLERLSHDVERWDCLLSPNRVSTPLLRRAFRYEGEVLEAGYPRNDLLSAPDHDEVRARVRRQLGIADGTTAVLYAPTWRDDVVFPEGGKRFSLHLDVDGFAERFGEDHCLLLRLHYMLAERLEGSEHAAVRDVSAHADVSELYLAADVLVTDYSSAMFDFAVTGKPMLFFVYDLADFKDRLRGFYFDLAPEAPGPLLATNAELFEALARLPAVVQENEQRYERFRERFCHLEDGRATERVVERLLRGQG